MRTKIQGKTKTQSRPHGTDRFGEFGIGVWGCLFSILSGGSAASTILTEETPAPESQCPRGLTAAASEELS